MQAPDAINGLFEFLGAVAIFFDVRQILRDRIVRGINPPSRAFFTSWGFWNLFYYPHLGQMLSFLGGCFIVVGNFTWLCLAFRFRGR